MKQLAIQSLLRPALTPVHNCKDHAVFQQTLNNIDQFLADSELESQAIEMALEGWEQASAGDQQKRARTGYGRCAWQCCVFYWEEALFSSFRCCWEAAI